jgi:hypothetical protein
MPAMDMGWVTVASAWSWLFNNVHHAEGGGVAVLLLRVSSLTGPQLVLVWVMMHTDVRLFLASGRYRTYQVILNSCINAKPNCNL